MFNTEFELMNTVNLWLNSDLSKVRKHLESSQNTLMKIVDLINKNQLNDNAINFLLLSKHLMDVLSKDIDDFITLKNTLIHLDKLDYKISEINLIKIQKIKDNFFKYEEIYKIENNLVRLIAIIKEGMLKYQLDNLNK